MFAVCRACFRHYTEDCPRRHQHQHATCRRCARSFNCGPSEAFGHLYILCADPSCVSERDGWVLADDQHNLCWQPCQGYAVQYTHAIELRAECLSAPLGTAKLMTVRWTLQTCRVTPQGPADDEDMCIFAYLRDYDGQTGYLPRIDASEGGWCASRHVLRPIWHS